MKCIALLCCFVLACTFSSFSGSPVLDKIETLKKRTAVLFLLPKSELAYKEEYKNLLPQAWTVTPIRVVTEKELATYKDRTGTYAYFMLSGIRATHSNMSNSSSYSNTHFYFALFMDVTKTGEPVREMCRIELYPDMNTTLYSFDSKNSKQNFRNFKLPYMMAYLRFVQKNLENGTNPSIYDSYEDSKLRSQLSKDVLYVPDSLIYTRNKFTGKESLQDQDLFKAYKGKYKYVSNAELIELLKTRDISKPFFLFEYVQSSTNKYVSVLDVSTGAVVYRRYQSVSYNLKEKDLERLLD